MTIPRLAPEVLERICAVLGETTGGLSHSEIDRFFAELRIEDRAPRKIHQGIEYKSNKRQRLYESLRWRQDRDGNGNNAAALLQRVMAPARYADQRELFAARRHELNQALMFAGLTLRQDGQLGLTTAARTLTEAQQRANRLRDILSHRGVHADVIAMCRAELLEENYFHAVLETTKSLAEKIRQKTGLTSDGTTLVNEALSIPSGALPRLAFNSLRTESEKSEQRGIQQLLSGMVSTFRNPTAHTPRIRWSVTEQDAIDLLTMASYLHRQLDAAVAPSELPSSSHGSV
jgi:uncharacterized protein (TIGR02391 family)